MGKTSSIFVSMCILHLTQDRADASETGKGIDMSSIPKIVILGAGYGGILTAQRLQKALNYNEADVTLVNRHEYHYFTTHLHMPAAGTDSIEHTRVSISKVNR